MARRLNNILGEEMMRPAVAILVDLTFNTRAERE
jgi:hypothetical protein